MRIVNEISKDVKTANSLWKGLTTTNTVNSAISWNRASTATSSSPNFMSMNIQCSAGRTRQQKPFAKCTPVHQISPILPTNNLKKMTTFPTEVIKDGSLHLLDQRSSKKKKRQGNKDKPITIIDPEDSIDFQSHLQKKTSTKDIGELIIKTLVRDKFPLRSMSIPTKPTYQEKLLSSFPKKDRTEGSSEEQSTMTKLAPAKSSQSTASKDTIEVTSSVLLTTSIFGAIQFKPRRSSQYSQPNLRSSR